MAQERNDFFEQSAPITMDAVAEQKLDEPILKKQMFVPDTPVFQLPEIPQFIFPQNVESKRSLNIIWSKGSYDSDKLAFGYSSVSGNKSRLLEAKIFTTSGQDDKGLLFFEEKKFDYFEGLTFADETVKLKISAEFNENTFYRQNKSRAFVGGSAGYHLSDGFVISDSFEYSKASVDDTANILLANKLGFNYVPNDENNFSAAVNLHRQFPFYEKSKASFSVGYDRILFRRFLLGGVLKFEYNDFYPEFLAQYKLFDYSKIFFKYFSGYDDLYFRDLYFRKNYLKPDPSLCYPKKIYDFSEGFIWQPEKGSRLAFEFFQKKVKNHIYWENKGQSIAFITPAFYESVYLSGIKADARYRRGNFELFSDILYNNQDIPYEGRLRVENGFSWDLKYLDVGVKHRYESERFVSSGKDSKLAEINLLDISFARNFADSLKVVFEGKNILSKRYEIQSGFVSSNPEYLFSVSFVF